MSSLSNFHFKHNISASVFTNTEAEILYALNGFFLDFGDYLNLYKYILRQGLYCNA